MSWMGSRKKLWNLFFSFFVCMGLTLPDAMAMVPRLGFTRYVFRLLYYFCILSIYRVWSKSKVFMSSWRTTPSADRSVKALALRVG
ncbi:hypothetical protein SAICODRAFT_138818 [Saitoella complicata NRRL Y-17804]|uniref:uncharacterized protein n=1 Tax=Saitoella complicata (strain BCRC 22490 / CBS 7301 / JCM 7358 / NBRC 10748 / NRRL Y-17804) TaxID=698492 RepID=UPI000866B569|nr:uncharacterized protein SAICODRAFT_138818 [Saitoella complicata NRRL Y-17804]ODQ51863.1 hypothetical protein SAICODRAFT_138818 [Saitoella complicata NRRL Y-17804]